MRSRQEFAQAYIDEDARRNLKPMHVSRQYDDETLRGLRESADKEAVRAMEEEVAALTSSYPSIETLAKGVDMGVDYDTQYRGLPASAQVAAKRLQAEFLRAPSGSTQLRLAEVLVVR